MAATIKDLFVKGYNQGNNTVVEFILFFFKLSFHVVIETEIFELFEHKTRTSQAIRIIAKEHR